MILRANAGEEYHVHEFQHQDTIAMQPEHPLLIRLNAIGHSLRASDHALALLGLGSVGRDTHRLDSFSDLDFFAIVEPGYKERYIAQRDWLEAVHPVSFAFQNTVDGCKLLFEDGIFCEYAVFEPDELPAIPFSAGRVVWSAPGFDIAQLTPAPRQTGEKSLEWCIGEALTNLYVGLQRYHRGEKLSAMFLIQCYALTRITEIAAQIEMPAAASADEFASERRFEQRFPRLATSLPGFAQGYTHTLASARAILDFLDTHFSISTALRSQIITLLDAPESSCGHAATNPIQTCLAGQTV